MNSRDRQIGGLLSGLLCIGVLALSGCLEFDKPTQVAVPMDFRPTETSSVGLTNEPPNTPIFVAEAIDERRDTSKLGENQENAQPIPILAAQRQKPGDLVRDAVKSELSRQGYNVVESADAARNTITIRLTRFWVIETGTYDAEIRAKVEVLDKSGKIIWSGTAVGVARNWGQSHKAENYSQVFSNAGLKFADNLVSIPAFQKALCTP